MGTFDHLPVYSITKQIQSPSNPTPNDHHFFNEDYGFLQPWIFGLLESFPGLTREETKSYILRSLRASIFSEMDTIVDQLIVKYYIEKYCSTHPPEQ
jgi:hypothetical protein